MPLKSKLEEIQDTGQSCSLPACFPGVWWVLERPTTRPPSCSGVTSVPSEEQEAAGVYKLN